MLPLATARLLVTLLLFALLSEAAEAQVSEPILVDVGPIGVAYVTVAGTLLISESVECVGEPLYVYEARPGELLVYLDLETRSLLLLSPTDDYVDYVVVYATLFAKPLGDSVWLAEVSLPYESLILLPPNASIRGVEPPPLGLEVLKGRVALRVSAGRLKLTYAVAPEPTTPSPPLPPPTPSPSPTTSPETPQTTPVFVKEALFIVSGMLAAAVAAIAVILFRRRGPRKGEEVPVKDVEAFFDERDKAIIEYLRTRGPSSPSDIMRATGIPRSAFYRRVERLMRLGMIESVDVGGRRIYKLKGGKESAAR